MTARFYTISKRTNSTKRPGGSYDSFEITLKQPTSIHEPTLVIRADSFNYNYCYIGEFSTYYFVRDVRSIANGLWEVDLKNDPMATFKNGILASTQFVERSANYANLNIIDTLVPISSAVEYSRKTVPGLAFDTSGMYFISVISNSGNQFTATYVLTASEMADFVSFIVDQSFWDSMKQTWGINPYDAILACYWLPVNSTLIAGYSTAEYMTIFDVNTQIYAYKLNNFAPRYEGNIVADIDWKYTDFRNSSPYTTMQAFIPGIGLIDIDVNSLRDSSKISFDYTLDLITGDYAVVIEGSTETGLKPIQSASGKLRVDYPVAQVQSALGLSNIVGTATGVVSAIGNFAVGNVPGGIASAIGAGSSLLSNRPVNSNGSFSSSAGFGYSGVDIVLTMYYKKVAIEPEDLKDTQGRPFYRTIQLSNLGGFTKCYNASVQISGATIDEIEAINSFLNDGFFIE